MDNNLIALFELTLEEGEIKVVQEKHYRIVPSEDISSEEIRTYIDRNIN